MSGTKRLPSSLLKISEIHSGHMQDMGDRKYFLLDSKPVHKVRIYGTVIEKREYPKTESNRARITIRIDDGTDTINITVWSYPTIENDQVVYDPINMVKDVEIGNIVDVLGRVKDFQDEFYIYPNLVKVREDIEWEIYRRSQLIKRDLEGNAFLNEGESFSEELSLSKTHDDDEKSFNESSIREDILQYMSDNQKYSMKHIAEALQSTIEEIEPFIRKLQAESLIRESTPGQFQILNFD